MEKTTSLRFTYLTLGDAHVYVLYIFRKLKIQIGIRSIFMHAHYSLQLRQQKCQKVTFFVIGRAKNKSCMKTMHWSMSRGRNGLHICVNVKQTGAHNNGISTQQTSLQRYAHCRFSSNSIWLCSRWNKMVIAFRYQNPQALIFACCLFIERDHKIFASWFNTIVGLFSIFVCTMFLSAQWSLCAFDIRAHFAS